MRWKMNTASSAEYFCFPAGCEEADTYGPMISGKDQVLEESTNLKSCFDILHPETYPNMIPAKKHEQMKL